VSPAAEVLAVWGLLVVAVGLARWRFARVRDQVARAPLESLPIDGVRRGVTTVVALVVPGLETAWREDPAGSYHLSQRLHRLLLEVAAEREAEVEVPRADGFRLYLGRFAVRPDHRAAGLDLALELRRRGTELLEGLGGEAPGLAVVTGDTLSAPVALPGGEVVKASWGEAPARALELAAGAAPGQVFLDARLPTADGDFRIDPGPPARLLGRAEEEGGVGEVAPEDSLSASAPGTLEVSGAEGEPLELSDSSGASVAQEQLESDQEDEGRG